MAIIAFLGICVLSYITRDMWQKIEELREVDEAQRLIQEVLPRKEERGYGGNVLALGVKAPTSQQTAKNVEGGPNVALGSKGSARG